MRKSIVFVSAAVAILSAASCTRELMEPLEEEMGQKVSFTVSFAGDATKTALEAGKTVWAAGDSILVSDGTTSQKVGIADEYVGKQSAEIDVDASKISTDNLCAVYPPAAFSKFANGVVTVNVANDQSGNFEEANICVAVADDYNFALKNATAIMKVSVPEGIETVMLSASSADTLAGSVAVTYGDELAIAPASALKSIKLTTGGLDGDYYVSVIPGTYKEFTLMALTLDGKTQKKTATAKTLAVNEIVNLGTIGDDLSGSSMEGSGSETDPFLVKDLADMTTLATMVNSGLDYEGQYFKATSDIEGISVPVGTFDQVAIPFRGIFDGQNHTFTLAMGGDEATDGYLGLFGFIGAGAQIFDVKVAGSVKTTGNYIGGVIASGNVGTTGAQVTNCVNNATISGGYCVGGVVGYAYAVTSTGNAYPYKLTNCVNNGTVTAVDEIGGVIGEATYLDIEDCQNNAAVTSTTTKYSPAYIGANNNTYGQEGNYKYCTGGVVGWGQNTKITRCTNNTVVKGLYKVGGVVGGMNWSNITSCNNFADITATGSYAYNQASQMGFCFGSIVGGVLGYLHGGGNVKECSNTGKITGCGGQGGIVGYAAAYSSPTSYPYIQQCKNSGAVEASNVYSGGIAGFNAATGGICGMACGYGRANNSSEDYHQFVTILECENNGAVSSTSKIAGGILGLGYGTDKYFWCTSARVNKCVNNAPVSATFWVGGIAGYSFNRYADKLDIWNCENHGKVTGTRSDKDNGVVAGGILGGCGSNSTSYFGKQKFAIVYNCYNDGDVLYSSETYVKPYVGGIIGNAYGNAQIYNCYNAGTVGTVSGTAPAENADLFLGGIAGRQSGSFCRYCYYNEDCVPSTAVDVKVGPVGTNGTVAAADVVSYDPEEILSTTLTINSINCSTLLQALNAWVNSKEAYYGWQAGENGPAFVK